MRRFVAAIIIATFAVPIRLAAQSSEDVLAYLMLLGTPAGGLTPALSTAMLDRPMTMPNVALRYGHVSLRSTTAVGNSTFDNSAVTVSIPVGQKAQIGLTGEYQRLSCDLTTPDSSGTTREPFPCLDHFVAGANAEVRLSSIALGDGPGAAHLTIGLNGEAGYAKPREVTQLTLTGGVPLALVARRAGIEIATFLTPAIGWGHLTFLGVSDSGTRPMLGGGVILRSLAAGLAANVGFQKVFIDRGNTVVGAGIVIGR